MGLLDVYTNLVDYKINPFLFHGFSAISIPCFKFKFSFVICLVYSF